MQKERRDFFKSTASLGVGLLAFTPGVSAWAKEEKEKNVTAVEDLMREHGALNRILLIYDEISLRLDKKKEFDPEQLKKSASIIQNFIQGYHEKLEEDFVFPRLMKANQLTDLVPILKSQHEAGRTLTSSILSYSNTKSLKNNDERDKLKTALQSFVKMYRAHEAREDTVLFPAFKNVVGEKEYHQLGENFEERERQLFGKNGFENIVGRIEEVEKDLGIFDLKQYSPRL
nr:hemerythrin domain-containing protein [uncultured Bdellovibrio sp.]